MPLPLFPPVASVPALGVLSPPLVKMTAAPFLAAGIPSGLKDSFSVALGLLFLIGFIWGVVNIWGGADKMKRGDVDGKMGIVSGIVIAGAAAIMGALFVIFGMDDGVLTPKF